MRSLGRHILVELQGCDPDRLSEVAEVEKSMSAAAKAAGAKIVDVIFHKFSPKGVSGIVVIAESHLAIHTWPERGFASADIFTCGSSVRPWKAVSALKKSFKAKTAAAIEIKRGLY